MVDVDLENFPTSEIAIKMMKRVSPIYADSFVGKWLFQVMGLELDTAWEIIRSIKQQCFLEQCTWGIRYWEERYGITVDESLDLETRRANVLNKRRKYDPMSPAALEDILEAVTGTSVSIEEDNSNYSFTVTIEEGDTAVDYKAVIEKLNSAKPSHLSYNVILPHLGKITLYYGMLITEGGTVAFTQYAESGLSDFVYLVDEDENTLTDENGDVLLFE